MRERFSLFSLAAKIELRTASLMLKKSLVFSIKLFQVHVIDHMNLRRVDRVTRISLSDKRSVSVNPRMRKESLVILVLVSAAVANVMRFSEVVLKSCYTKYLDALEKDEVCEVILNGHIDDFYKKVKMQMSEKDNKACIVSLFKKYEFQAIYLRGVAKNYLAEDEDREDIESTMQSSLEQLLGAPRILCHKNLFFEDVYAQYKKIEPITSSSELSNDDLCMISYLLRHKILNVQVLNSFATERLHEATNCQDPTSIFEQKFPTDNGYVSTLFGMPRKAVNKCIHNSMRNLKTSAYLYSVEFLLSRFRLDDQQKVELKKLFTNMITASIKMTNKCISKI